MDELCLMKYAGSQLVAYIRVKNAPQSLSGLSFLYLRTKTSTDRWYRCEVAAYATKKTMETSETAAHTGEVSVKGLTQSWMKWSSAHQEYQKHNPFSNNKEPAVALQPGQEGYGIPPEGSKTQQRGQDAHSHVSKEVQELCRVIREIGEKQQDGRAAVRFGTLFEHYVGISNKVVGVLLRARRQGLVHFEGEMLWQGRDDQVLISLLQ